MFPTPQNNSNELDRVMAEYLAAQQQKGGDPATNGAPPAPFTLNVNGRPMQFAGPEDASAVVTATVSAYEQKLAEQHAAAQAEQARLLEQLNQMTAQRDQPQTGAPQPAIDPEVFARSILTNPVEAITMANQHDPTIKELRAELDRTKRASVEAQFVQRHPHYANPQAAKVIGGILQQGNLQFTPEHLELAVSYAQQNGMLPNEAVLAQQAQAAQMQRMAQMFQQPGAPQVGGYENFNTPPPFGPPQNQPPAWPPPVGYPTAPQGGFAPTPMMQYAQQNFNAPPPSPGRTGYSGGPTSFDAVNSVAHTANIDDLKGMIEQLQMAQNGGR